jgi:D-threonate/D-erythronate kinase
VKIGVLADDLTGAGDAALAFWRAGFPAEISLWPPSAPPREGVWVISTETRGSAHPAYRVRRAARLLKSWKPAFIFKKIDSTLRGPLAVELAAFRRVVAPPAPLAFVPAFPALGRTTRGGRHFVDGVPLHRTAFAKDPLRPVRTDRVAELAGEGLWIPDVWDARSLSRAAARAVPVGVAAGSAGFAAALARRLAGARKRPSPQRPGGRSSPVLLVSGSAHPRSRAQWDAAVAARFPGAVLLSAPRRRQDPRRVLSALARRAAAAARERGFRRFAVTGGDTAAALARRLGVRRWRVARGLEEGIPLLVSSAGNDRSWWVTKPGGFGTEDVWKRTLRQLARTA